jgi:hypothetical protein
MRHLKFTYCLTLALASFAWLLPASAMARESTCPNLIKPQAPIKLKRGGPTVGHLTPVDGQAQPIGKATLIMDFGPNRGRNVRTQTYRLSRRLDPEKVRVYTVNDIIAGNDPLPIGHQQLTYRAGANATGELVNVRVCYDPGATNEPEPGRYVGALLVSAPGAKTVPLGIEFTFRDDNLPAAVIALVIGVLAGVILQAAAIRQQAPQDRRPKGIKAYIFNFRIMIAIGGGAVGALTAYSKLVSENPTWDCSDVSLLALASAAFGATVVTKSALDLKGPTASEKSSGLAS